jgi:glycerophosphoryl diester phosphodiesterase
VGPAISPPGAKRPLVIGHRGASGYRPEHTLASYALAIEQGADYIEPDLVMTGDGVLVARHENEIGGTTDVAARPEFSARRRTQFIDGEPVTGWFTEDFTLAEIKSLRARERLPQTRVANTAYDGCFDIPTFTEILALLAGANQVRAARGLPAVGVYPETKHPTHFANLGLALEAPLLAALADGSQGAPVVIQSFEAGNLRWLRQRTAYGLVRLAETREVLGPLDDVATYADVLGVAKSMVIPCDSSGGLAAATPLVDDARRAGLAVHVWTFRAENTFLPTQYRRGPEPGTCGNLEAEIRRFLDSGIDGFFTDQPDVGRAAVDAWVSARR